MRKLQAALSSVVLCVFVGMGVAGCGGGDDDNGGTPAAGLNVSGFWEDPLNGATAAGNMTQNVGNVTGGFLLPPAGNGQLIGTLNGYHMEFTMAFDDGPAESGSGDFAFVNTSEDALVFNGTLPSVGPFEISWRGPSFEQHSPAGAPLEYTPLAPTW